MKTHRQEYQHQQLGERASRTRPVLSGLLLGGLIGAGTALLFAPKSGEQTRAQIQQKTIELRDRTADGVKDAVSQVKSKTRQVTSSVLGKTQEHTYTQYGQETPDYQMEEVSQTASNRRKAIHDH